MSMTGARSGFTIIEVLIAMFLIGTVVVSLFGLFVLGIRLTQESERRVVAVALANERAEMIRNLPYASVGTSGGIPGGSLTQNEVVTRNHVPYTVVTDVRYIDDAYDGTATSNPPDLLNTDYKQARVAVSWNSSVHTKPVLLLLTIAPPGIEGGQDAGTLVFRVLDANAGPVPGAAVTLDNTAVNPQIHIATQTDAAGTLVLPGLPPANTSYKLEVTKTGYTAEQTLDQTVSFNPDAAHSHLTALVGQITAKTFIIDKTAILTVHTVNLQGVAISAITYHLKGTKSQGTDAQQVPVVLVDSDFLTNASGLFNHAAMVWDSYDITINGQATGYDIKETSTVLPVVLNPQDNLDVQVTLVPHVPFSLQATIVSPTNAPVDNATVTLTQGNYTSNLGTGVVGQVFFADVPGNGNFTLTVDAPGFAPYSQTVTVAGTTRVKALLTPAL